MNANRPPIRWTTTLAVVTATTLVVGACGPRKETFQALPAETTIAEDAAAPDATATTAVAPATEPTPTEPAATTAPPAAPAATSPGIHAAVSARQALTVSATNLAAVGRSVAHDPTEPPTADVVAGWIADLTRLERALDADAIRGLGDDPVFEQLAGPIGELDAATIRVIDLLDPPSGEPDILGALVEVQAAVTAWEDAVPGMEAAWEDAVTRWSADWELAVADWEQEWADAVAQWETEWENAVNEWELEWQAALAEWEQEWAAAVAEWETEWEDAVSEWEQAWQDALDEWQREAEQRRAERRGETDG